MSQLFRWVLGTTGCALALALATGCGQQTTAPPANDPAVLMERWHALTAVMDRAELDFHTATAITEQLKATGPQGLDPLLDVLGADEEEPLTKLLALMCLQGNLETWMEERLLAFTALDRDQTTRTCSIHLLGQLGSEAALARIDALQKDEDDRVANSAYLVLLYKQDPDVLARAAAFWAAESTTDSDRDQFMLVAPADFFAEHLDIVRGAVANLELGIPARLRGIELLVQFGQSQEDLAVLEQAAAQSPEEHARQMAASAKAALESRLRAEGLLEGGDDAAADLAPESATEEALSAEDAAAIESPGDDTEAP